MPSGTTDKTVSAGLSLMPLGNPFLSKSFCFDFKYINYLSHYVPTSYVGLPRGRKDVAISIHAILIYNFVFKN